MNDVLLHSMFKGAPKIPVPWPYHGRLKGRPKIDPQLIEQVLATPAVLAELDPSTLNANQPWILEQHVAYYLTQQWHHTGRTSADRWDAGNRFPLVLPDHRGRPTIVCGHHRAAAALLEGRPLLARVAPGEWDVAAALTPTLFVAPGDDGRLQADELRRRGLDEAEIRMAFAVARPMPSLASRHC